ncbi:hypothetical protein BDV93DRAFT_562050 [Ceratobasidium sp. AG-I]|nr:hypothetical protein BDV93DRAFT_562050 [Ceratobasidium sp. AG-I]
MNLIHNLVLFLVTALALVHASPTSDPSIGGILARANDAAKLECGTHASQSTIAASQSNFTLFASSSSPKPRRIRIYWHVIYDQKTFDLGYLTDNQIRRQVRALNTHFRSTDISFKLEKIDRTQNSDWFYLSDTSEDMRRALHRGGCDDLNIYSVWFQGVDFGGFSTWPWGCEWTTKLDGVVLQWNTIPGGPLPFYNEGKILVHQVGHWCGLLHTFEGGCSQPGDFVFDTPPEAAPNWGCPNPPPGSCPNGGKDPIHNFMDYTVDECKTHFTEGQGTRMRQSLAIWRHNP